MENERPDPADSIRAAWARIHPEVDTSAADIVVRLMRIARIVERTGDELLKSSGLRRPELELLMLLRRHDIALSPTTISHELMFSAPATTKRLTRLANLSLVSRLENPDDGRGHLIQLTQRGTELTDQVFPELVAVDAALLSVLPAARRTQLADDLRLMLQRIETVSPTQNRNTTVRPR